MCLMPTCTQAPVSTTFQKRFKDLQSRKYNFSLSSYTTIFRFPKEAKKTVVEKTNDPGPATYAAFSTVGVMPRYQRNEANARIVQLPPQKSED